MQSLGYATTRAGSRCAGHGQAAALRLSRLQPLHRYRLLCAQNTFLAIAHSQTLCRPNRRGASTCTVALRRLTPLFHLTQFNVEVALGKLRISQTCAGQANKYREKSQYGEQSERGIGGHSAIVNAAGGMQWMQLAHFWATKNPVNAYFTGLIASFLEEEVGFEPTVPCGTPDFESGTFGHSATLPSLVRASRRILAGSGGQATQSTQIGTQGNRHCDAAIGVLVVF